jgi:hypothetical protein
MNEKYYVNFSGFEEYKEAFEKKITEFRQEVFNVFKLNQEVDWKGSGYDSASNSINLEIDRLNTIPQVLDLYVDFMDKAINNYSDGMEEIRKSFEEILEVIRIEKRKRGELTDGI